MNDTNKKVLRADREVIKSLFKLFKKELLRDKKRAIHFISFITTGHIFRFVIAPLLMSFLIQSLVTRPEDISTPLWLIGGLALSSALNTFLNDKGYTALFRHEESVSTRLLDKAIKHLMHQSYQFFSDQKVGTLAGEAMNFARSYQSIMDTYFLQTSHLVIGLFASLIVVGILSPVLLLPLTIITIGIFALNYRNVRQRAPYRNERKLRTSRLTGTIADIMGNQILTRVFAREDKEAHDVMHERRLIEKVARKEIEIIERESLYRQVMTYSFQIITLCLAVWLFQVDNISIAALIFMVTYLIRTSDSIFGISSLVRNYEQAILDASPMMKILNTNSSVSDQPGAKKMHVNNASINFNDVDFHYTDSNDDTVFKSLSLNIPAGQRIGLAGHSGGGKTTLTKLLLRFADITAGEILIDGQNISHVTQASLRKHIAYVPQDPFLFHRTLRENIGYGRENATDEEIKTAAEKAHAMEFIQKLPNGLDTTVGERGVKLSGGQRQRIAIARAILRDAPILVLDEATSALDSESEKLIQESLEQLMKDRTSIVIAHRLSTIAKLDRIIVLDKGAIAEDGSHKELLERDGIYASLWNHQSGGFIEE